MTTLVGLRGTGQFTVDYRPTSYRELFTLLEPNGSAPLNALLSMTSGEATDDPKFNHFRDELPPRALRVNAAHTTGDLTLTVVASDDVNFAVTNVLMLNTRTNEVVRATVSPPSATTITVARAVAGTTAIAMAVNDVLAVIGYADIEGGGKPTAVSFDPTTDFNYTQIFKTGTSITGTLKETFLRTGDKESEKLTKALKMHMSDIERAMFFGRRSEENGSTAQPRRYTGGLFQLIPTVIDAAAGFATANTITEDEFDRVLIEQVFAFGNKQKVAFCGPRIISNLQKIAKKRWSPTAVRGSYGVSMTGYETFAGDLMVHMHPLFRQIPGYDYTMVIVDLPFMKYRHLANRDTMLKRDVQGNDTDGSEHYYLTECGLELMQGKPHTVIRNWQAA